ncbi:MAG: ATP-binding cassette domain-containing protein [Microbacterium sp.]|nr:ATP-binding cassette domain-containing protein [Microbacterium sp.]
MEEPVVEETAVEETGLVEHAPAEEALVEAPGPAPEAPVEEAPLEEPGIDRASAEASVPSAPEAPVEAPEASDADLSAASESETASAAGVIEDSAEPFVDASAPSVPPADAGSEAIRIRRLVKTFGDHVAVNGIDLTVPAGSFYGIVGPNGAGKTTTLSIVAGLLRAESGEIVICGIDQSTQPLAAKRVMGVLPDRLRTFDRLTGRQLLYYYGLLRGLAANVIEKRVADLARAFDLGDALSRVVSDYSAGMTKKIMLAGAMIHSPRVLVLDEPFEAVDPVSSAVILDILRAYVAHGGTVILSSHGMDLVERVCSRVAIIVGGDVLAEGTIDEVRAGQTLESRFVELAGSSGEVEGLEWLHTFSD